MVWLDMVIIKITSCFFKEELELLLGLEKPFNRNTKIHLGFYFLICNSFFEVRVYIFDILFYHFLKIISYCHI